MNGSSPVKRLPPVSIFNKLAEINFLWFSFVATLLMTCAFQVLVQQFDLILLDGISNQADVQSAITDMSDQQKNIHAWMTGTLDLLYPIAYGCLFIGSAYRFYPSKGLLLALPGAICIPVDLIEGVVQITALTDLADWTVLKPLLTPLKELLFVTGFLITISGWVKWSYLKISSRPQA